jgi:hypothetical protein
MGKSRKPIVSLVLKAIRNGSSESSEVGHGVS